MSKLLDKVTWHWACGHIYPVSLEIGSFKQFNNMKDVHYFPSTHYATRSIQLCYSLIQRPLQLVPIQWPNLSRLSGSPPEYSMQSVRFWHDRFYLLIMNLHGYHLSLNMVLACWLLILTVLRRRRQRRKKQKHRFWVRQILQKREQLCPYHTLEEELCLHEREFFFRYSSSRWIG